MNFETVNDTIVINLPSKNAGKFRYKKRSEIGEYGKGFATATENFDEKTYIEWQIGYDVIVTDVDKKPTKLTKIKFIGANGKEKHPYELSELLYFALKTDLVSFDDVKKTIEIIKNLENLFEEDYKIKLDSFRTFEYNNLNFQRGDITLPNFFFETEQGFFVEVSIQKQQYASGVQPMVYISIPVILFSNSEEMIGSSSNGIEKAVFVIDQVNASFLLETFQIFGMCSSRHKHDVIEILSKIIRDIN